MQAKAFLILSGGASAFGFWHERAIQEEFANCQVYLLQAASRRTRDGEGIGNFSKLSWGNLSYSRGGPSSLGYTTDIELPFGALTSEVSSGNRLLGAHGGRETLPTIAQMTNALAAIRFQQLRSSVSMLSPNGSASTAALLLLAVLIVSLTLYAAATALDRGKGQQDRETPRHAESMLRAWPPMSAQTTPLPSKQALSSRQVPARVERLSTPGHEEGLPTVWPQLVMPNNYTHLAVPLDPLLDPHFELDVLSTNGVRMLSASTMSRNRRRSIEISLHAGTLLAVVTPNLQITRADGSLVGSLARSASDGHRHVLRNSGGRTVLVISSGKTPQEVKMVSPPSPNGGSSQGLGNEQASVSRRPAGHLPAEHYEVVVSPNADAVLMLACFLALVVFELPPPSTAPVAEYGYTSQELPIPAA